MTATNGTGDASPYVRRSYLPRRFGWQREGGGAATSDLSPLDGATQHSEKYLRSGVLDLFGTPLPSAASRPEERSEHPRDLPPDQTRDAVWRLALYDSNCIPLPKVDKKRRSISTMKLELTPDGVAMLEDLVAAALGPTFDEALVPAILTSGVRTRTLASFA